MLKRSYWGLVVGAVVVASSGCSGSSSDDDDSGGSSTSDAAAKCTTFISVYCSAAMDCLVEGGTITASQRSASVDTCKTTAASGLDCTRAVGVSSSYDACITAVTNPDCDVVNAAVNGGDPSTLVPEVCKAVILLDP